LVCQILSFLSSSRWNRKGRSTTGTLKRASVSRPRSGGLQVQVRWGVLSCFWVLVGPWLLRSLWGTVGGRCISPAYPDPGVCLVQLIWAPSMALTLNGARLDRPWSGGFQDQARLSLFVLLFGALWASGSCGSCAGVPRGTAVFPWPVPDPGVSLFR
jgi:hypothetical protein